MAGIDEVLERLVVDPAFRTALQEDPESALAGYTLTEEDLKVLGSTLTSASGQSGSIEQRTSKAGLFGGILSGVESAAEPAELEKISFTYQRIDVESVDVEPLGDLAADSEETSGMKIDGFLKVPDIKAGDAPGEDLTGGARESDASDSYGRVKQQFPWDQDAGTRSEALEEQATPAGESGSQDGTYMVSSVTHQTVDSGDPDQPVVVGRVYNEAKDNEEEIGVFGVDFSMSEDQSGPMDVKATTPEPGAQESDLDFVQRLSEQPSASDDSHEVEMDVHVGKAPPQDVPGDVASASEPSDTDDQPSTIPEIDDETLVGSASPADTGPASGGLRSDGELVQGEEQSEGANYKLERSFVKSWSTSGDQDDSAPDELAMDTGHPEADAGGVEAEDDWESPGA